MTDLYQAQAKFFLEEFDKRLVKYDMVENLHKKTGIKRAYLVLGVGLFAFSFLLFGFGAGPLCNIVGYAYPLYASFKAINSDRKDDDSQWLTYWVVFAFFSLIESFADVFLFWIPMYHFLKMAFLLWCYLPQWEGALLIYKKFIDPYLEKAVPELENDIALLKKSVGLKKPPPSERIPVAAGAADAHTPAPATGASAPAASAPAASDAHTDAHADAHTPAASPPPPPANTPPAPSAPDAPAAESHPHS